MLAAMACVRGRVSGDKGDPLLGTGALGEAVSRNLMFQQREVSRCETLLWLVGGWGRKLYLRVTCRSRVSLPIFLREDQLVAKFEKQWNNHLSFFLFFFFFSLPLSQMLVTLASFLPQTLGEKTHRYLYARMLLSL